MSALQTTQNAAASPDDIGLGEMLLAFLRHWRRIAICTAATTLIACLIVVLAVPKFAIDGSLYLGDARPSGQPDPSEIGLNFLSEFQTNSDIDTQIGLINSKGLIQRAVLETGLNAQIAPANAGRERYWHWLLFNGGDIHSFEPKPGDLQASDASFDGPLDHPVKFTIVMGTAGAYTILKDGGWFSASRPILEGTLGAPAAGGGLSLLLKASIDGAAPAAGRHFNLKLFSSEAVTARLLNGSQLSVLPGGSVDSPTKIANLELFSENPYVGKLFVNQLMNDFIESQISWHNQAASNTEKFIAGQLNDLRSSLTLADQKLAAYQAKTGIIDVPENAKDIISQISQYQLQRAQLLIRVKALSQLKSQFSNHSGMLSPYLVSLTDDAALGIMSQSLASAYQNLTSANTLYTGNAPDMREQEDLVANIQRSMRSLVDNDLAAASVQLDEMDKLIAQADGQLKAMPAESLQVIALTRTSDVLGQTYVLLMQKQAEAEVSKAATDINTWPITPAANPLTTAWPKPLITILLGFFAGLIGSTGWTLVQRAFSFRFQSDDEIRELVSLPVYGLIPQRSARDIEQSIFSLRPQTTYAEAFRLLRGNIYRSASENGPRVLLVTSAGVDDGKTTVAANLAKTLADDGKSVILVDADLHVGRVGETLKAAGSTGLAEWLVTTKRPLLTKVEGQRFAVLSAGAWPPNPGELLNQPKFAEVIATLRSEFDYVVIDSPPFPTVADGDALGAQADLILSVIRIEHTQRSMFAQHGAAISQMNRRQGIIINGVVRNSYGYGYAYEPGSKTGRKMRRMMRGMFGSKPARDELS